MDIALSPQTEQFLASVVADGLFASKEAALEAAVAALREKTEPIPFVPDEHMARVEASIDELEAGLGKPMTPEYWEGLRKRVLQIAARRQSTT